MASRRKFSDEYKREAVRLATEPGVTKSQVGRELGINANLLSRWCNFRFLLSRREFHYTDSLVSVSSIFFNDVLWPRFQCGIPH